MRKLSHNKKRNVGLVYEFLTREVSVAVVSGDRPRAAEGLRIIDNHLTDGTPLFPELSLHRQVMESRGVSERLARRIVDEIKLVGSRMSIRKDLRELAKADLIHEMNRCLGRDIFDRYRIPDYTAHASISILMARGLDSRLDEGVEAARVEDHLIEFLTSPVGEPVRFDRDASMYAYKTAVGLFEQEFGAELSAPQAEILREYIRVSLGGNPAPFERSFERQRTQLREDLRVRRHDPVFKDDVDMGARLDEAIKDLADLDSSKEESVERLLLYWNLSKELES